MYHSPVEHIMSSFAIRLVLQFRILPIVVCATMSWMANAQPHHTGNGDCINYYAHEVVFEILDDTPSDHTDGGMATVEVEDVNGKQLFIRTFGESEECDFHWEINGDSDIVPGEAGVDCREEEIDCSAGLFKISITYDGQSADYIYANRNIPGGGPTTGGLFFYPANPNLRTPDMRFALIKHSGSNSEIKAGGSLASKSSATNHYEDCFSGSYVIPYNLEHVITSSSSGCNGTDNGPAKFLSRSSSFTDFEFASENDVDLEYLADYYGSPDAGFRDLEWNVSGLTLKFPQGRKLVVGYDLDVVGATLTEASTDQGWGGVRFEAGSDGHWSGNATIEKVKGWGSPALRITNASPTFSDVTIRNAVSPSAVYGIEINGANAYPTEDDGPGGGTPGPFHDVRVLDMTSDGIRINSGANLRATGLRVEFGGGHGVVVGYSSEAFLHPHTFSPTQPGAQILTNDDDGLRASNGSYTTLGHYYYDQYGVYPAYGLNTFTTNGSNGVQATGGTIQGGSSDNKTTSRNLLYLNTSVDEAFASGGTAYLRCNWWGEVGNPPVALAPETGTSGSGLIYEDLWLDKNPYQNSNPNCADFSGGSGGARYAGDSGSLSPEAEWLLAGIESAGDPTAAMAHFERILAEAPDSPEAAAALVQIGWMAQRPNAVPEMLTRLESASRSDNAAHRHAALQGLIRVRHHERDTEGALALADQLLDGAGKNRQYVHEAQIERANLLAELGRQTEATQALAHASAQGRDTEAVGYTRSVLGIREDALRAAESVIEEESVSEQALLPPTPNPTQGLVRVPLRLVESTYVRAEVLDVLGRVVETVADGPFDEGEHTFSLDTKQWAPGVYILRAELQAGESSTVTEQTRFTVVR